MLMIQLLWMDMDIWHCLGYHHHSIHMFTIDHHNYIQNIKQQIQSKVQFMVIICSAHF